MLVAVGRSTRRFFALPWVVARDHQFGCLSPVEGVSGEDAGAIEAIMISEIAVQRPHAAMVGI